jgi:hypothetical protein
MARKHFHVLWAVDATQEHKEIQMKTAQVLKALLKNLDAEVEPVTVLSPDQVLVPAAAFRKHSDDHRLQAEKILEGWSREAGFSHTLKPTLLVQYDFSISRSTGSLLSYAKEVGQTLSPWEPAPRRGLRGS